MNEGTNPFQPGAGTPPPELAGREDIMRQATVLLQRVKGGRHGKSMLLTGLRGVGKPFCSMKSSEPPRNSNIKRFLLKLMKTNP